jgi:hypothetical protein
MFCGKEKIPPPIIDPTTKAISAFKPSFCIGCDIPASPFPIATIATRTSHKSVLTK